MIEGHIAMGRVTAEVRAERTCRSESMRRWDVARAGHERDDEGLSHITTFPLRLAILSVYIIWWVDSTDTRGHMDRAARVGRLSWRRILGHCVGAYG